MIKIGENSFQTRRPADLDSKLIELTGCNAAEAQRWLKGSPLASGVAAALLPFLAGDNTPDRAQLSMMIAEAGADAVAPFVAALYVAAADNSSAVAEPAAETHGDGA